MLSRRGCRPCITQCYLFDCVFFRRGCRSCILSFCLYFLEGLSPLHSVFLIVFFKKGLSPLHYIFLIVFFRRGCRPCITQYYLFVCIFQKGLSPLHYAVLSFPIVLFRRGCRPLHSNFCLYFSEGVVAPALCSAIRQRSNDQITTSVRCQSQCSKSKGMYCSDAVSHFVQRLFLRRLFNTSFIVRGDNTDHIWPATVHGDHYITGIFQELG